MTNAAAASDSVAGATPNPLRPARALRETAIAALRAVMGSDPTEPYALLDFPRYANVGDNAIWLGTLAALEALGFPPPAYTSDDRTFEPRELERRVGRGPILLLGGGNFGDLHRKHQRLREAVATAFPDNRVVQLPQTLRFRSPDSLEQARRVLGAHRHLKVLVRDEASLRTATHDLGLDASLAPDLAFGFVPPKRPRGAAPLVLWISRTDEWNRHESPESTEHLEVSDWPPERNPWRRRKMRGLVVLYRFGIARVLPLRGALSRTYEPLARWRVDRALAWMSRASVIVTDRLHGHILATMIGTPHVLLDDSLGKLRAFHDMWTSDGGLATWASDPADALARAKALLPVAADGASP